YYFSVDGDDTNGNGTQSSPWRNINYVADLPVAGCHRAPLLKPGYTILFRSGDVWYRNTPRFAGDTQGIGDIDLRFNGLGGTTSDNPPMAMGTYPNGLNTGPAVIADMYSYPLFGSPTVISPQWNSYVDQNLTLWTHPQWVPSNANPQVWRIYADGAPYVRVPRFAALETPGVDNAYCETQTSLPGQTKPASDWQIVMRTSVPVGTLMNSRIETIEHTNDSSAGGYLLSFAAQRICPTLSQTMYFTGPLTVSNL